MPDQPPPPLPYNPDPFWAGAKITLLAISAVSVWLLVAFMAWLDHDKVVYAFKQDGDHWHMEMRWEVHTHHRLVLKNKKIEINVVNQRKLQQVCCPPPACMSDHGHKMTSAGGCEYDLKDGWSYIWIPQEDTSVVLLHELCHSDGSYTKQQCEEMFP